MMVQLWIEGKLREEQEIDEDKYANTYELRSAIEALAAWIICNNSISIERGVQWEVVAVAESKMRYQKTIDN